MDPRTCLRAKEVVRPQGIVDIIQLEYSECSDGLEYSVEDWRFLKIMEDSARVTESGHFELALPFRDTNVEIPCNKAYALKRLMNLKKRLLKDPSYHEKYVAFMGDMIQEGHCEPVPLEEIDSPESWCIPHFGVVNVKKPGKVRMVFDCAARCQGVSLNDTLLSGPDLTNSLIGVLMRFRLDQVAFTADINGMFHQVKVRPADRNFLKFSS